MCVFTLSVLYSVSPVLYCPKRTPWGRNVAKSMMKFCAFEDCPDCSVTNIKMWLGGPKGRLFSWYHTLLVQAWVCVLTDFLSTFSHTLHGVYVDHHMYINLSSPYGFPLVVVCSNLNHSITEWWMYCKAYLIDLYRTEYEKEENNFVGTPFQEDQFHDKCSDRQSNLCSSCTLHDWLRCLFTYGTLFGCRWIDCGNYTSKTFGIVWWRGTINPLGPCLYFSMHTVTYDYMLYCQCKP